jgi:hypothetical protein
MSRSVSLFVAAVALATSPFIHAADAASERDECAREEASHQQAQMAAREPVTLAQIFAAVPASDATVPAEEGSAPGSIELVVARIGADGKVVMACVDNEKAARHFLEAPREKLVSKQAKEQ